MMNIKKPKYNSPWSLLPKFWSSFWIKDDLIFVSERHRLQYIFILRIYYWTGGSCLNTTLFFTDLHHGWFYLRGGFRLAYILTLRQG